MPCYMAYQAYQAYQTYRKRKEVLCGRQSADDKRKKHCGQAGKPPELAKKVVEQAKRVIEKQEGK